MFVKACATHSSAKALVKFFSPTQWGAPMMPHSVKATIDAEEDRRDVEEQEGHGEEGDEEIARPVGARRRPAWLRRGAISAVVLAVIDGDHRDARPGGIAVGARADAAAQPSSRSDCHFVWIFVIASSGLLCPAHTLSSVLARKLSPA